MPHAPWPCHLGDPISESAAELIMVNRTYPGLRLGHYLDEMVNALLFRFECRMHFQNTTDLDSRREGKWYESPSLSSEQLLHLLALFRSRRSLQKAAVTSAAGTPSLTDEHTSSRKQRAVHAVMTLSPKVPGGREELGEVCSEWVQDKSPAEGWREKALQRDSKTSLLESTFPPNPTFPWLCTPVDHGVFTAHYLFILLPLCTPCFESFCKKIFIEM